MSPEVDDLVGRLRAAGCVFAEDEARLLHAAATTPAELDGLAARRIGGEPLEYIVGYAEFCGRRVTVTPGVFVPRVRTGLLVRAAVAVLHPGATVVDLGCGSGAVGAAIQATVDVELYAVDIDPVAVACARRNVGGAARLGDLYDALPTALRGRVHAVVANAPYVPTGAIGLMPPEARDHEHRVALDGGGDGLDVVRRAIAGAPGWLAPGGHLLVETGAAQAPVAAATMLHCGLSGRVEHDPEIDGTVVIGQNCHTPPLASPL